MRAKGAMAVACALLLAACGGPPRDEEPGQQQRRTPAADRQPSPQAPLPSTDPGPPGTAPVRSGDDGERQPVVVDLAVEWRPESTLSDEELREQRTRVEAAQDEVLAALGSHGHLTRRLTATAQMSLTVDPEGMGILRSHPKVATVHEDRPDPPD